MARTDPLLTDSSLMELQSPSPSSNPRSKSQAGGGGNKRKTHPHRKDKKVKKQRMWKSLSRMMRRPKSSYSALHEDDSRSPIALDFNGNCADEIDWKNFSLNSRHDECETIVNTNALNNSIASHHHHQHHHRPAAHHAKSSVDSSDSSSSRSDASTIHNNVPHNNKRQEMEMKKLELQIEFYASMNRMRPRVERVMEKLEAYVDAKLKRKPSDDLRFLQSL